MVLSGLYPALRLSREKKEIERVFKRHEEKKGAKRTKAGAGEAGSSRCDLAAGADERRSTGGAQMGISPTAGTSQETLPTYQSALEAPRVQQ
ncbi:hypothetical protein CBOM_07697 [Ceraceosorus bombacis]|uniref:Uncharacterized protein n=1 Tax=Ceraceosorus bombacis TaxID=401625 RepID=A0A0P1BGB8_9BASI|nr:hypothetical protein CBOM_07697 [Ceraceosorus bombacis]